MKRLRSIAISLCAVALMSFIFLSPAAAAGSTKAQPQATTHALTQAVTGTTTSGDTFSGTYTITKFVSQGRALFANGTLSGTLTNATGSSLGTISNKAVSVPVASAIGSCSILTLSLGALHLNLLGLTIDLNPVLLVINAVPGAGNLLGNLLCAVAGLLNGGLPLGGLSGLLNEILSLL